MFATILITTLGLIAALAIGILLDAPTGVTPAHRPAQVAAAGDGRTCKIGCWAQNAPASLGLTTRTDLLA